ncbi:MAG: tetratricopeptide repeat protein [Saprospiraceae bacterium]
MSEKSKPKQAQKPKSSPVRKEKTAADPLTETFRSGFWSTHWIPSILLLAMAFALYLIGLKYGYVLDDEMTYWKNEYVQKGLAGIRQIFSADSFMGYFKEQKFLLEGGRYRPLSLATFAMEVEFFGPNKPAVGHFFNVLLYGFTGVLMYRILLGLFPIREGGRWFFSLPFIASALFMLHPLHVECVENIKGRDEILALLGGLGALWATLKYFDTKGWWWMLISAVSLLLGMFAKENALTFVVVIPLTVWFFTKVSLNRVLITALPLLAAALLFIWVRYEALGYLLNTGKISATDIMNNPFFGMTGQEKIATIFLTLGWYIKLLFLPHPLTIDYYPYHVPKVGWSDWRALAGLALNIGMGLWALWNIRKRSIPAYAILFYLLTLSIVSNLFVSVGTFMNERFLYMPSMGFCILAGWFFTRKLPEWLKEQPDSAYPLGMIIFACIAGLLAYRVVTRIPDWQSTLTLNGAAVKVSEGSARSHCFYATGLYEEKYVKTKNREEKERLVTQMEYHVKRSLEINPNYGAALIMKFNVAAARLDLDKQLDKFFHVAEEVLEKIPYNATFRKNLAAYLKYLDGSNADKYMAFCYRAGYEFFWKKKNDPTAALFFLEFALNRQYEDIRTLESIAEISEATGNAAMAAEFRARANAQK